MEWCYLSWAYVWTFVNKKLLQQVIGQWAGLQLSPQTCDHIEIMKQSDMTVGPISQIILDQIKFGVWWARGSQIWQQLALL